jgi:hypothetical protein
VTIAFHVTIDNPYSGPANVSNQGAVSGSNFSNVLTDDPAAGGATDPTLTPVNSIHIRVNDAKASEPQGGTAQMLFAVTLSGPDPSGLSLQYATADGGAGAAATDQTMTSDLGNDVTVGVFTTTDPLQVSTANRLDAVGFGANTGSACDLLREGATLPALAGSTLQYSYFRNEATTGQPADTNDNASDFLFADTAATSVAGMRLLGAPGPENKTSPINRGASVKAAPFDPAVPSSAAPNRERFAGAVPNGANGTLVVRRTFNNNTGGTVTRLRFRVVDMTAGPGGAPGSADLRLLDTAAGTTTITGGGTKGWVQMTLEQPPAQGAGGGVNSTVTAVPPGGAIGPGGSINIQFTLGVQQTGTFRFFIIVEALP